MCVIANTVFMNNAYTFHLIISIAFNFAFTPLFHTAINWLHFFCCSRHTSILFWSTKRGPLTLILINIDIFTYIDRKGMHGNLDIYRSIHIEIYILNLTLNFLPSLSPPSNLQIWIMFCGSVTDKNQVFFYCFLYWSFALSLCIISPTIYLFCVNIIK